jgi:zinc-ribbon domain
VNRTFESHCRHCGEKINERAKYCLNCGKRIEPEKTSGTSTSSTGSTKKRSGLFALLKIAAVLAFFFSIVATAALPATWRIAGPVFCPKDSAEYEVLRTTRMTSDGTSVEATLYCVDDSGRPLRAGSWFVGFVVFGLNYCGLFIAVLVLSLIFGLFRRRVVAANRPGAPIQPS